MDTAIDVLVHDVGCDRADACKLVGRSRASHYRARNPPTPKPAVARKPQPRALSEEENAAVLAVLHSDRFIDSAPAAVYAHATGRRGVLGLSSHNVPAVACQR